MGSSLGRYINVPNYDGFGLPPRDPKARLKQRRALGLGAFSKVEPIQNAPPKPAGDQVKKDVVPE